MSSIAVTAVVLACLVGGSLLGMFLRGVLPEHHLSQQSTDVIKLGTGLMATLAALVLSLLISSAKTTNEIVKNEMTQSLANIVVLDRYLAQYGPETRDVRELIRRAVMRKLKATWSEESFEPIDSQGPSTEVTLASLQSKLQALSPHDDAQKWFLSGPCKSPIIWRRCAGCWSSRGPRTRFPCRF